MVFRSVTEVAEEIGCRPRDISDAFYAGYLDDSRIVKVAGRRAIPPEYVPEIREAMAARGKVRQGAAS